MRRTLYGVFEKTRQAAAELRDASTTALSPEIGAKLARFEEAVINALGSSPDGQHIAHPEEMVALDALCDLHVSLGDAPEALRERFRPILDDWISYAVATGMTPQEMSARAAAAESDLETWLDADDRPTG